MTVLFTAGAILAYDPARGLIARRGGAARDEGPHRCVCAWCSAVHGCAVQCRTRQGSAIRIARAGAFAGGGRQIVDAGGPTGRGGAQSSINTTLYLSQTACACRWTSQ